MLALNLVTRPALRAYTQYQQVSTQCLLQALVAIDRTSKFAFVKLYERATRRAAADFLSALQRCRTRYIRG